MKEIAKILVVLKRVRYLCTSNTRGQRDWTTRAQRTNGKATFKQKNIKPDRTKTISLQKPKDDPPNVASGWIAVGGWMQGAKKFEDAVKIVEAAGTTWGDITKESEETQNRGVEKKRLTRLKCGSERGISPRDPTC